MIKIRINTNASDSYYACTNASFDEYLEKMIIGPERYIYCINKIKKPCWVNTKYIESITLEGNA